MKPTTVWSVIKRSIRSKWVLVTVLAAIVLMAMVFEAVPALVLRKLVDDNLAKGNGRGLWLLAVLFLVTTSAQRIMLFGQNYFTTIIGQDILHSLRMSLVGHLGQLPLKYYDTTPVGETMSRLTADIEAVNTLFTSGVVSVIADSLKIGGVLVTMFALSTELSLVTLGVIPVVLAVTEYFRRNIRRAERETRRAVGMINAHYQESLSGIRVIHSFGQEVNSLKNLEKQTERFLLAINRSGLYTSYFGPLMDFLKGVASVGVVWAVARAMGLSQAVSVGVLVAFLQLVSRLFTPLTALSDEYQSIQQALAGAERINELLAMPPELRPALDPLTQRSPGRVVIWDLEAGYIPGRPVLRNVNLDVPPGQRIAIVGRTGAGKTSLLNQMAGVYAPWNGVITIDGIDPRSLRPEDRRRLLGVVPQTIHIFEGSIKENITLGDGSISDGEVQYVARVVGLHDLIMSLPKGYDTQIGSGGANLSHGQEQLLSLARAIVCKPAVLLLDEPTSGLDTETEKQLFAAIREESKQRTTITVSHRLSGVMDAERVIVMARGQVVQDGTPAQLAHEDGWYAMMTALEAAGWQSEVIPGGTST